MIKLVKITKKLDDNMVLNNISLDLKKGKIYGFVGRNGSGKTMLFRTICGLIIPSSGQLTINNEDIFAKNYFPQGLAALIEKPKFLSNISGYENLEILASIQNKIGEKEIINTLKDVDLFEDKDKKFGKYSLGMKQKLGIAQVLMENPDIMIFDEPLSGLDKKSVDKIRMILIQKKKDGKLILVASHILEDVQILCDEIFEMDKGEIVNHSFITK